MIVRAYQAAAYLNTTLIKTWTCSFAPALIPAFVAASKMIQMILFLADAIIVKTPEVPIITVILVAVWYGATVHKLRRAFSNTNVLVNLYNMYARTNINV